MSVKKSKKRRKSESKIACNCGICGAPIAVREIIFITPKTADLLIFIECKKCGG